MYFTRPFFAYGVFLSHRHFPTTVDLVSEKSERSVTLYVAREEKHFESQPKFEESLIVSTTR